MQDGGSGWEWGHTFAAGIGTLIGAVIGGLMNIGRWLFSAGGKEPELKDYIKTKIGETEIRVEAKIEAAKTHAESKIDGLVTQFHDTFAAMRQKINEVEQNSVSKDEFNDFRRENREDFQLTRKESREDAAELKRNIAEIIGRNGKPR